MDKSKLIDSRGIPLSQGLFLEFGYQTRYAIYTLQDEDRTYKGKPYPSLKKLFLETEDPTEYSFANIHLLNWNQWKKIKANTKLYDEHIRYWQEELELLLRSRGIAEAIKHAEDGTFQAAKWLADRGWESRGAGRPTQASVKEEKKFQARVANDFGDDIARLEKYRNR